MDPANARWLRTGNIAVMRANKRIRRNRVTRNANAITKRARPSTLDETDANTDGGERTRGDSLDID